MTNKHSEHAENSSFFQQLDICCQKIAGLIGEKQISEWTNSDYINLSRLLSRKTKIRLSESTLKRIFGKSKTSERYYPQKATRDALAQFIGYENWDKFEFRDTDQVELQVPNIKTREYTPNMQAKNRATWLVSSVFLGIAFLLAIIVLKPTDKEVPPFEGIQLMCVNPDGITPHSAIFKLVAEKNLPDSADQFSIEFGDGRTKRQRFTSNMLNHYYEVPGRYYPLLFYKNRVIDTAYVYLQTKDWSVTGYNLYDTTRVYPVPVRGDIGSHETIAASANDAFRAGVDTLKTFFLAFSNVKPTNISADNFELSVELKTSANRAGVRCSQVNVTLYGEKDRHYFSIMKPECTVWTSYQFSENRKDGSKYDLRAFGHDLSNSGLLKFQVRDKKVTLFIDGRELYNTQYNNPMGNVMGINIAFSGIGEFKNFQLKDLKTGNQF
ncbi:hypothetical protein [Pedobacter nyackensis]|uniref:hypothetical protein n=1 Tax=Pedobacter nyackensis TaxID=475255 RepID=UPI00292EBEE9|nr:hypothetical protein [Pedobacter nyackensis]